MSIEFIKNIGSGTFGSVDLYNIFDKLYAIKCIPDKHPIDNEILNHYILKNHPNIIGFIKVCYANNNAYIVQEYAENGDLFDYFQKYSPLSEYVIFYFMKQLFNAVEFCHFNNIAHCDIKLENILLDKDYNVRLTDFGYSRNIITDKKSRIGTLHYMAPEIINNQLVDDTKIDIYACGVCMYILLHGKYPFYGFNFKEICINIIKNNYEINNHLSIECIDLLKKLLEFDYTKRISISDIKKHNWFQKFEAF
jgi:serine/threonine-protein kinase SRK2